MWRTRMLIHAVALGLAGCEQAAAPADTVGAREGSVVVDAVSDTGARPDESQSPDGALDAAPAPDSSRDVGAALPMLWGGVCVSPRIVRFGARPVGLLATRPVQLRTCGVVPAQVTSIRLLEDRSSPDFWLDLPKLPGGARGGQPSVESPLVVLPGAPVEVAVRYVPDTESEKDRAYRAIPERGVMRITLDSPGRFVDVEVTGVGYDLDDPAAVIYIEEGEQVSPQTALHLRGDQSFAPSGPVATWEWTVEQPVGSQTLFVPSATATNPTFDANVVGSHLFKLTIRDEDGKSSSIPDEAEVLVVPDEPLHVELLWNTPGDADQTDEGPGKGADLDLHLVHAGDSGRGKAEDADRGGWFHEVLDCWSGNPSPTWAAPATSVHDRGLEREDADGAGPEIANLRAPEDGAAYRIGVHFREDYALGPSYALVRVYVEGALVHERQDVKLTEHDLWDVGTVAWPSGVFTPAVTGSGAEVILPGVTPPRGR